MILTTLGFFAVGFVLWYCLRLKDSFMSMSGGHPLIQPFKSLRQNLQNAGPFFMDAFWLVGLPLIMTWVVYRTMFQ